jgi:PIN domain nuclease of toxin-antitoxin system
LKLLLDTHALLWWLADDPRLSAPARTAVAGAGAVFVSAISAYEIAQKHRLGKLHLADGLLDDLDAVLAAEAFEALPVAVVHATLAGRLVHTHRDPFDRLLIAQGLLEQLTLVSNDGIFDQFGVARVW